VLQDYDPGDFYDELFESIGQPRSTAQPLIDRIKILTDPEVQRRQQIAQKTLFKMGVTFNVYSEGEGKERILPFDIIPRIISATDWSKLEKGLTQRTVALNAFLTDIYSSQHILKDQLIPQDLIETASGYQRACLDLKPPNGIWCHITGTDLVRDRQGEWYVLEDNLRCPSGVSYVLENRRVMKKTFPLLFESMPIRSVDDYPSQLLATLMDIAPDHILDPTVVVLTPGIYNSAYFEHSFLAQQMGVQLVESSDLVVADGLLKMRTTRGLQRVDVVYRRIDEEFIDPLTFRADSMMGIPGLMEIYRQGRVGIANAIGTGVADDKAVYSYVPEMIRYYLGEEPILNNVPTYRCREEKSCKYVLEHLGELVVKAVAESGGYGMLIGPASTEADRTTFAEKIQAHPENYIAQPTLQLSRVPTLLPTGITGCHVDLRPYILYGKKIYINPGGLTRVALKPGSLVVNSSQGGGTKDTWVLCPERSELC
jgi:uncharacterized circularly permuted ATP-grasp superfamily protein